MAMKVTPFRNPAEPKRQSVRDLAAAEKGVLRFLTCGSVDDGKSTLIGRLLYDTKLIFEDQLASLKRDSVRHGTQGENIDFALLLDGLEAEREQGITIDVAYRFFSTDKRKFIVADTPGHEQYTRNMATGASTADVAVILIDARKGVLVQTKRHTYIADMLGVRHVVLAVNKMDLVEYSRARFHEIVASYLQIAEHLGFESITPIPMSALKGENVTKRADTMPWHPGPTLLEHLEAIEIADDRTNTPFRMPVQWVNRPNLDFRGFSGTVTSGSIKPGDGVVVAKSGKASKVKAIVSADGDLPRATAGDAVTLVIEDEIDASRGDVFAAAEARPEVSNQFTANILWMTEDELTAGHAYLLKIGSQTVQATVTGIRHKIDINTLDKTQGHSLGLNEIGFCNVTTNQPIAFDPYRFIRESGAFILIDRFTNQTVGAGMIEFSLMRATNVHRHAMDVTKATRSLLKGHRPAILWFTGLSGAGKSTIANLVERRLADMGAHTYSLDGDNIRQGLNKDLGFTDADRVENIRRIGEVAKLFVDSGLIVTASFISPFRAERDMVRGLVETGEFIEVFVDAPLALAEKRDPKGLYKKARAGQIRNFTGIDSPYEAPVSPELRLDTSAATAEALADQVIEHLRKTGVIGSASDQSLDFSI
ncbi:MAG: sulfate adenylyltransferase subunit CysN [Hyphomonadaceae bacterium]|nr:sulfate adenylyltransferase subunit CysN [Hyphomonadaceae bacterium]